MGDQADSQVYGLYQAPVKKSSGAIIAIVLILIILVIAGIGGFLWFKSQSANIAPLEKQIAELETQVETERTTTEQIATQQTQPAALTAEQQATLEEQKAASDAKQAELEAQIAALNTQLAEASAPAPAPSPAPKPAPTSLPLSDLLNAAKLYYDTKGPFKGVRELIAFDGIVVDGTHVDIFFGYKGDAEGYDSRRFTYALDSSNKPYVITIGAAKSGLLTNSMLPPPPPVIDLTKVPIDTIMNEAKNYYDTKGPFKGTYVMMPKQVKVINASQADVFYEYTKTTSTTIDGKDSRRFTFILGATGQPQVSLMGAYLSGLTFKSLAEVVTTIPPNPTTAPMDDILAAAKLYYDTVGPYQGVYTMTPKLGKVVNATQVDILYDYTKVSSIEHLVSSTPIDGTDSRRFTFAIGATGKPVATAVGANMSGLLTKPETVAAVSGVAVRTYEFMQGYDISGNDLPARTDLANNIPALKTACDALPNCYAFNTNGYLKSGGTVTTIKWTTDPTKGLYFIPGKVTLPPKDPTSVATLNDLTAAAKAYYDTLGPFKGTYIMDPKTAIIVNGTQVDIFYSYSKVGTTTSAGYDSRRFTYALNASNKPYVTTIGANKSGLLTNSMMPVVPKSPTESATLTTLSAVAKTYYDTLGPFKNIYTMTPKVAKVVGATQVDIFYAYVKVGSTTPDGYDSRRFTYSLDASSKPYVTTIGAAKSGLLTNSNLPPTTIGTITELVGAAKSYYDNNGPFKGVYTMSPKTSKVVNGTQVDIFYAYVKVGSTTPAGYDSRRFTYALNASNQPYVTTIGATKSGLLTNSLLPPPDPTSVASLTTLAAAAKTYYDTQGPFKGIYTMIPKVSKVVGATQVDIFYSYSKVGSTTIDGYDSRRFTYSLDASSKPYVTTIGATKSGLLTNSNIPAPDPTASATINILMIAAKTYYDTQGPFKGTYVLTPIAGKIVDGTHVDIYYSYSKVGSTTPAGYDSRRFTYALDSTLKPYVTTIGANQSGLLTNSMMPVVPKSPTESASLTTLSAAAKTYYDTLGPFKNMYTMTAKVAKVVGATQVDIYYSYSKVGSTAIDGYDSRRFTYALNASGQPYVTTIGANKSGLLTNSYLPAPDPTAAATISVLSTAAKTYYDTQGPFKGTYTISPKSAKIVDGTHVDIYYSYSKVGSTTIDGYDSRRFTYALDSTLKPYVTAIGANKSGLLTNSYITPTYSATNHAPPRSDGRCGPSYGYANCGDSNCCSSAAYCGTTSDHCTTTSPNSSYNGPTAKPVVVPTYVQGGLEFYSGGGGYVNGWTWDEADTLCKNNGSAMPTADEFKAANAAGYVNTGHYVWLQPKGYYGLIRLNTDGTTSAVIGSMTTTSADTTKRSVVCKPPPTPTSTSGGLEFYSGGGGYANGWTWAQAKTFCTSIGGHLPSSTEFSAAVTAGYHNSGHYVWLAGTQQFGRAVQNASGVWVASSATQSNTAQKYSIVCKKTEHFASGSNVYGPKTSRLDYDNLINWKF